MSARQRLTTATRTCLTASTPKCATCASWPRRRRKKLRWNVSDESRKSSSGRGSAKKRRNAKGARQRRSGENERDCEDDKGEREERRVGFF